MKIGQTINIQFSPSFQIRTAKHVITGHKPRELNPKNVPITHRPRTDGLVSPHDGAPAKRFAFIFKRSAVSRQGEGAEVSNTQLNVRPSDVPTDSVAPDPTDNIELKFHHVTSG